MFNSRLYKTEISHIRLRPKKNQFKYKFYHFLLDLDEVKNLHTISRLLGYEMFAPLSFYEKDHLKSNFKDDGLDIKERIKKYLKENKIKFVPKKIFLLTHLRIFNYVFNPVSFYYCYGSKQELRFVIAEVNNTFSEQKIYLIDLKKCEDKIQPKHFYVSPFIHYDCDFEFLFRAPGNEIFLEVNSRDKKTSEALLKSNLKGSSLRLDTKNLLKLNLAYPFITLKVIILIHWQALRLFVKKISYFTKKEVDLKIMKNQKT